MNIKNFIFNNNHILEEFARELRDEIYLETTLISLKKLKFRYLRNRKKIPVTKHDIEVAINFLSKN